MKYSYGPYNKYDDKEQWIRLTEGCPHNCPWCYEPQQIGVFNIPDIVRRKVRILDMNMLVPSKKPEEILQDLPTKLDCRFVYYEFICGIDHRFLDPVIARLMKEHHFQRIRIAWDWYMESQYSIKDALKTLYGAGYRPRDIIVFMICNHEVPYDECMRKLDLCKVWNVKVADCYYDNQIRIFENFKEEYWREDQALSFRTKVRKHNQLVNFGMDPELKRKGNHIKEG